MGAGGGGWCWHRRAGKPTGTPAWAAELASAKVVLAWHPAGQEGAVVSEEGPGWTGGWMDEWMDGWTDGADTFWPQSYNYHLPFVACFTNSCFAAPIFLWAQNSRLFLLERISGLSFDIPLSRNLSSSSSLLHTSLKKSQQSRDVPPALLRVR